MTETVTDTTRWKSLEKRSAVVFLVAGLSFLVAGVIGALGAFTPMNTEGEFLLFVEGIGGFGGVVLSYIGLLSLYPRLRDHAPTLARTGVWLVAVPAVFFLVLLVWEILAFLVGLSSLTAMIPRLDIVTEVVFLLLAVGISVFGVIYLRDTDLSGTIGYFLLLFAAAWVIFIAAVPMYGFPIPPGINLIHAGMTTVALLGIGYRLRTETGPTDRAEPTLSESGHD